ncbi:MAG: TldD/PmbA family protein [Alphaproteobacteria bacterium]
MASAQSDSGGAPEAEERLTDLVARLRRAGADAADAVLVESAGLNVVRRLRQPETLERSESREVGLRVFCGHRQATVATTDLRPAALADLVDRALAMARAAPEDPFSGLAEEGWLTKETRDLDLLDPAEPAPEALVERAAGAEEAALAVPKISNSEGAEASWSRSTVTLAASNGFTGCYAATAHGVSVAVVAKQGEAMERDYEFAIARHGGELDPPEKVGRRAGERAARRLGARKVKSAQVPVVYEPRVAGGLLRHLAGAIAGPAIARGTSFLKDRLESAVFAEEVTVTDDPHRRRGLRSKPFDGEGVGGTRRDVVARGTLTTWLLDCRSARQLGLKSTGHAARGPASPPAPAPTNLYLAAGSPSPEELIADIRSGLYLTELIGMGVNLVTGDYSRGAAGFWIENGELGYPVSEVTVAGKLTDMFTALRPANDLAFRYGVDAPTVRIDGMTVAGR